MTRAAVTEPDSAFEGRSVLIVDGTHAMRSLFVHICRDLGFRRVHEAATAQAAADILVEWPIDLVIADWQLPDEDGFDLVKRLRSDPVFPSPNLPVIFISGQADLGHVLAARDVGVTEFLRKPVSAGLLRERMVHVLKNPRQFVEAPEYRGPDRRRRHPGRGAPRRRRNDDGRQG
jgi:CheY-like chemotaxis protein